MKNQELPLSAKIKAALIREREQMRQERYEKEFSSIYNSNLCPVCHHRHMVGALCRMHRGNVCARHCLSCQHYETDFHHCLFRETEPVDTRKWKLIGTSSWKEGLRREIQSKLASECVIADRADQLRAYRIINTNTGELLPVIAVHLQSVPVWAAVQYLPAGT